MQKTTSQTGQAVGSGRIENAPKPGNSAAALKQGLLGLMATRRFAPFFWTQFMGAFNDNVFKNALMLMIAFTASRQLGASPDLIVNLAAGLFILPFFLFSAPAGQIADKMEKSMLVRRIKLLEIAIMAVAGLAFFTGSTVLLLGLLFLMGSQSAFFGPVKYSIMPEHLKSEEIVGGNALVEMGTLVAPWRPDHRIRSGGGGPDRLVGQSPDPPHGRSFARPGRPLEPDP
jgi:hypothetical protein